MEATRQSGRKPPMESAAAQSRVKCTNCGNIYTVDALDPEMRCPKCEHTGWMPAQPEQDQRAQKAQNP